MKRLRFPDTEVSIAMQKGVLDMLTVVDPDKVEVQGVVWVKRKIKQQRKAEWISYSQKKWRMFWRYFARIWITKFPPAYWNVYGMQREIVNRTNNPFERYRRELNTRFKVPHPVLTKFVDRVQERAYSYVIQWESAISKDADAPTREPMQLPRAAKLPDINDIEDSDTEEDGEGRAEVASAAAVLGCGESDLDEELNVSDDSSEEDQCSAKEHGPPRCDASFDYETEEKS